jgi:hypothetical protein
MKVDTTRVTVKHLLFVRFSLVSIQCISERKIVVPTKELVERDPTRDAISYQDVVRIKQS